MPSMLLCTALAGAKAVPNLGSNPGMKPHKETESNPRTGQEDATLVD